MLEFFFRIECILQLFNETRFALSELGNEYENQLNKNGAVLAL